jgi:2-polyprenyl-6-methoxyphenol hydroxylase-like FAD-dependent oxidoreductase
MLTNGAHTEVLIIGAGPSGLMMAAQLLRLGVQPVIIDAKKGPAKHSKAMALQARSLEIYRQFGIADRAVNDGSAAYSVAFSYNGNKLAAFRFSDPENSQSRYPYVLFYQQSKNEQLLLGYLTRHSCPVYWNTVLTSLKQDEKQVTVNLNSGGQTVNITCDWLIGADGTHSEVRSQLKIPFTGQTYPSRFFLADVKLDNHGLNPNEMNGFLSGHGFAGFFPYPEAGFYRITGNLPYIATKEDVLTLADLLPHLKNVTGTALNVKQETWFTVYRLHCRMADKFRDQRCFLIGDAAHIHSPVGGQGMNTGLQDAYNLAWKLAGVVNKQLKETILESYTAERMPVARKLLRTTDRAFNLLLSKNWFAGLFKKTVISRLLKIADNKGYVKDAFFFQLSQTGIHYRDSAVNLHLSHASKIKAGDRLPYMKLYDEKRQEETDLHEWCSKPGFTLIVFGKFDELFLFNVARWITIKYANLMNFFYLPPTGKNLDIFNAFEVSPHLQKAIIVRPDMHIGFINDAVDLGLMDNYLKNVVGVR